MLTSRLFGRAAGVVVVATLGSACAKPQAQVAVEPPPPLMVPAPPPRIIVPPDPTPPEPPEEVPLPTTPSRPRPARPAPPRPDRAEPPKPAETAEAAKPPNGQETTTTPTPPLEMQPGDRGDGAVRQQLSKAADDLQKVNYVALSNDLKVQYDTAKRFITLGEQALREQNLIFAATLADKAGAIATLLLRR